MLAVPLVPQSAMQLPGPRDPLFSALTLTLIVLLLLGQVISVSQRKPFNFKEVQSDTLYGREVPIIKMLKRQLKNFRDGRRASITLVFYATQAVYVRWFRLAPKLNMGLAEIPNMLPIEGDRDYKISFLSSGEVTATTLGLPNFKGVFPRDYETILTSEDGTLSYQIRTVVHAPIDYRLDDVDSPEWMAVPSPTWSFRNHNSLKVHCKVFVPNENPNWTNELNMYRAILVPPDEIRGGPRHGAGGSGRSSSSSSSSSPGRRRGGGGGGGGPRRSRARVDFQTVVGIHKETQDYAEENGASIMQGMRIPLRKHVIYELRLKTQNATGAFEGVYQCALERQWDKLYISSVITLFGNPSPFPGIPLADLVSCERQNYDRERQVITFNQGQETCIRCRGIGYPQPEVAIYRHEREVTPGGSWDVGVTKYINVRDAGVSEATYIFWSPQPKHAGKYSCRAFNERGSNQVYFTIYI